VLAQELSVTGDAVVGVFVEEARADGHSWSEIGAALGVTKQAAQQRQRERPSLATAAPGFARLTAKARRVLGNAEQLARDLGHDFVGTEHLLLAMYRDPSALGTKILKSAKLNEAAVTNAMKVHLTAGISGKRRLRLTSNAKAAMKRAVAEARSGSDSFVGTEHLLAGLAKAPGVAHDALLGLGLTADAIRQASTSLASSPS